MPRIGCIALCLFLLGLTSCASGPNPVVVMETSMGPVKIELFQDKAPITVDNFLQYVDAKHYDGTVFHRVMQTFMIQGGGYEPGMKAKKGKRPPIRNEASNGLLNERGTLAMARTKAADSASDEFFINVVDNDFLNRAKAADGVGYAVFGKVIDGMDVVDKIRVVKVVPDASGEKASPVEDIIIKSIRRVETK